MSAQAKSIVILKSICLDWIQAAEDFAKGKKTLLQFYAVTASCCPQLADVVIDPAAPIVKSASEIHNAADIADQNRWLQRHTKMEKEANFLGNLYSVNATLGHISQRVQHELQAIHMALYSTKHPQTGWAYEKSLCAKTPAMQTSIIEDTMPFFTDLIEKIRDVRFIDAKRAKTLIDDVTAAVAAYRPEQHPNYAVCHKPYVPA